MALSSKMSTGTAEEFEVVPFEGVSEVGTEGKHEAGRDWKESKESFIERRTTGAYLEPHELIRQLMVSYSDWEVEGDVTWLSRTMRDWCLRLVRSLMRTYSELPYERASELAKVCVWESVRRTLWHDGGKGYLSRKLRFGLQLVAIQEVEWSWSEQ